MSGGRPPGRQLPGGARARQRRALRGPGEEAAGAAEGLHREGPPAAPKLPSLQIDQQKCPLVKNVSAVSEPLFASR